MLADIGLLLIYRTLDWWDAAEVDAGTAGLGRRPAAALHRLGCCSHRPRLGERWPVLGHSDDPQSVPRSGYQPAAASGGRPYWARCPARPQSRQPRIARDRRAYELRCAERVAGR